MKEKRFFCDLKVVKFLWSPIGAIVVFFLTCIIVFISIRLCYGNELKSFSESKLRNLEIICSNIIEEGKEIHLSKIPEEVGHYRIEYYEDNICFSFYLKETENLKFVPKTYITVRLSKDLEIISKQYSYSSELEYYLITSKHMKEMFLVLSVVIFIFFYVWLAIRTENSKIFKNKWIRENVPFGAQRKW